MAIALKIANWIITFFFISTGLFTLYDMYFPKEEYQCATLPISFIVFVLFPLSVIVLTISLFEIKKLLRREWQINHWQRKVYWAKDVVSSVIAITVVFLSIGLIIGEIWCLTILLENLLYRLIH